MKTNGHAKVGASYGEFALQSVDSLADDLSNRAYRALRNAQIEDIVGIYLREQDLTIRNILGCGDATFNEINVALIRKKYPELESTVKQVATFLAGRDVKRFDKKSMAVIIDFHRLNAGSGKIDERILELAYDLQKHRRNFSSSLLRALL